MNKAESKYFHTAQLMDEALLSLLEKKDFEYITIKEICEKAGVNRSTFYLHYQNVSELLYEAVEYMNDKFLETFPKVSFRLDKPIYLQEKSDLCLVSSEYLLPYLEYIYKNRRLFRMALVKADTMQLHRTYDKLFSNIIDPIMQRFDIPENERRYFAAYYIHGIMAIITEWMRDDCRDEIRWIANLIEKSVMPKALR